MSINPLGKSKYFRKQFHVEQWVYTERNSCTNIDVFMHMYGCTLASISRDSYASESLRAKTRRRTKRGSRRSYSLVSYLLLVYIRRSFSSPTSVHAPSTPWLKARLIILQPVPRAFPSYNGNSLRLPAFLYTSSSRFPLFGNNLNLLRRTLAHVDGTRLSRVVDFFLSFFFFFPSVSVASFVLRAEIFFAFVRESGFAQGLCSRAARHPPKD